MIISRAVPLDARVLLTHITVTDPRVTEGSFAIELATGSTWAVGSSRDAVFAGYNGEIVRFYRDSCCHVLAVRHFAGGQEREITLAGGVDPTAPRFMVGPVFHPSENLMAAAWGNSATAELVVVHALTDGVERLPLKVLPWTISWRTSDRTLEALVEERGRLSLEILWPFQQSKDSGPGLDDPLSYCIASTGSFLVGESDSPVSGLDICARDVNSDEWTFFGEAIVESDLAMSPHRNRVAWWELAGAGLQLKMRDLAEESTILLLETEDLSVDPAPTTPSWSPTGEWLLGATHGVMSSTLHIVNVESRRHIEVPCRGLVTLAQFLTEPKWQ